MTLAAVYYADLQSCCRQAWGDRYHFVVLSSPTSICEKLPAFSSGRGEMYRWKALVMFHTSVFSPGSSFTPENTAAGPGEMRSCKREEEQNANHIPKSAKIQKQVIDFEKLKYLSAQKPFCDTESTGRPAQEENVGRSCSDEHISEKWTTMGGFPRETGGVLPLKEL
ncbi:hypothetical protein Anapl_13645 [Anas platyrhynchos]|uniref:Uncharacterized protein n=1 Tax=Anas platyrhynchos TaxID=8839 RepID=R0KFH5_ANAPL|nr:hypothetical protein Anapl_13645 [Anas platyrhynchos]